MSLFGRVTGKDTPWQPADAAYPSLFDTGSFASAVKGKSGLYALWHLGVRPQWLRVAAGTDLAACLAAAAAALKDSPFRGNGGIFTAWAFADPGRCPGIVVYLRARLRPALGDPTLAGEIAWKGVPAPVVFPLPPGTTEP